MIKLVFSLALVLLAPLALADCNLVGGGGNGSVVTDQALCLSQGAGSYTFAMTTGLAGVIPLGSSGGSGQEFSSYSFQIMDNSCKLLAVYPSPSCGIPFTIKENFLQYVLTITNIFADVGGDAYFSFSYANGAFSIGNNGCVCSDMKSSFNSVSKGCRCAFPVAGEPKKREVTFEA